MHLVTSFNHASHTCNTLHIHNTFLTLLFLFEMHLLSPNCLLRMLLYCWKEESEGDRVGWIVGLWHERDRENVAMNFNHFSPSQLNGAVTLKRLLLCLVHQVLLGNISCSSESGWLLSYGLKVFWLPWLTGWPDICPCFDSEIINLHELLWQAGPDIPMGIQKWCAVWYVPKCASFCKKNMVETQYFLFWLCRLQPIFERMFEKNVNHT